MGLLMSVVSSEELRSFLLRFYRVLEHADEAAVHEMVSPAPHALLVGSDPDEWVTGGDVASIMATQTREMAGVTITHGEPTAYCDGNVGWIADRPHIFLPNGVDVSARLTAVLSIEHGHWRIVQWHLSLAQPNPDALGYDLTTSIDKVEQLVRDDRPDLGEVSAPDGTVTIVFTDIESSTVLLERLGDTEFLALLAWHDRIVHDTAAEYRGFIVKSQGDGFMLAFASAASALRATLVLRERIATGYGGLPIQVRAGLHAGEAIRHQDDFFGRTVVVAARISALALGGEILASDLVYGLARGLGTFTFGEPRTTTLKGLDGNFPLYPVLT
jgi:class 3 adenylate cyclase